MEGSPVKEVKKRGRPRQSNPIADSSYKRKPYKKCKQNKIPQDELMKPEKGCKQSKRSKKTEPAQAEVPRRSLRPRKSPQNYRESLPDSSNEQEQDVGTSTEDSTLTLDDLSVGTSESDEDVTTEYTDECEEQLTDRDVGCKEQSAARGLEYEKPFMTAADSDENAEQPVLRSGLEYEEQSVVAARSHEDGNNELLAACDDMCKDQSTAKESQSEHVSAFLFLNPSTHFPVLDPMDLEISKWFQ